MINTPNRKDARRKRHYRLRKNLFGSDVRPRMAVCRSVKHISVQIINDLTSMTLVSASSMEKEVREQIPHGGNIEAAKIIGALIAKRAQEKGITAVVYDRGGSVYHGRVAELADAARAAGLKF